MCYWLFFALLTFSNFLDFELTFHFQSFFPILSSFLSFSLDWLHSSFIFNVFNFFYYLFSLFRWALKKKIVCRKNLFSSVIASYFISSKFVFLYLKRITVQVENVRVRGNFVLNLCFTDKLKNFQSTCSTFPKIAPTLIANLSHVNLTVYMYTVLNCVRI